MVGVVEDLKCVCWLSPVEVWCVGRTLNKCIIHEGRETIKEKLRTDGQLVKPLGSDASMGIEYRQWGMREKKEHRRNNGRRCCCCWWWWGGGCRGLQQLHELLWDGWSEFCSSLLEGKARSTAVIRFRSFVSNPVFGSSSKPATAAATHQQHEGSTSGMHYALGAEAATAAAAAAAAAACSIKNCYTATDDFMILERSWLDFDVKWR